jgi:hypothetical protein
MSALQPSTLAALVSPSKLIWLGVFISLITKEQGREEGTEFQYNGLEATMGIKIYQEPHSQSTVGTAAPAVAAVPRGVVQGNYFLYRVSVGMLARSSGACFCPGLARPTDACCAE